MLLEFVSLCAGCEFFAVTIYLNDETKYQDTALRSVCAHRFLYSTKIYKRLVKRDVNASDKVVATHTMLRQPITTARMKTNTKKVEEEEEDDE